MALTKVTYAMIADAAVNVKDYGATGDGTTNDTVGFQAACAAALAGQKTLYVPAGTYKLTDKVEVPFGMLGDGSANTTIQGVNAAVNSGNLIEFTGAGIYQGVTIDGAVSADPSRPFGAHVFTGWENLEILSDDVTCIDIVSQNSAKSGFRSTSHSRLTFIDCRTDRTRNLGGDGFYNYKCFDCAYINCRAVDYTRVGFVFDGDAVNSAQRVSYDNCYAEDGHDAQSPNSNSGFWAENHDSALFKNCISDTSESRGFVSAATWRNTSFENCTAIDSPYGFLIYGGDASDPANIVFNSCFFDSATADVTVEPYNIGANTITKLQNCAARLDGSEGGTIVVSVGDNTNLTIENFHEHWTARPTSELYDLAARTASIGGFVGAGAIVPSGIKVNSYNTYDGAAAVVKWTGTDIVGKTELQNMVVDVVRLNTDENFVIEDCVVNATGDTSRIYGNFSTGSIRNCQINDQVLIGWADELNSVSFESCYFTRSTADANVYFYRTSGTAYKPLRLKLLNCVFNSNLETLNYYVRQNAAVGATAGTGQDILATGCVFYNAGGATSNVAIFQNGIAGVSTAYVGSSWKSSTITNVATNLNGSSVIQNI